MLIVTTADDGRFVVMDGTEIVGGPFETNAEAWRWIDRAEGEPISKAEARSAFVVDKILNGGKLL